VDVLDVDEIEFLRSLRFSFTEISIILGISGVIQTAG